MRQYVEQLNVTLRTNDEVLAEYLEEIKGLKTQCLRYSIETGKVRFTSFFNSWAELIQGKETQPRWVNVARLLKEFEQLLVAE